MSIPSWNWNAPGPLSSVRSVGGPAKIVNPPGADPLHHEYLQGNTTQMTYSDAGQDWKFEGSNYMLGTFELDSEQYKTYAAGLAQKMSEKKSKM